MLCNGLLTSGPRTRTFRCFVRLWFCPGVFGVFVLLPTSGPRTRTVCDITSLSFIRDIRTFHYNEPPVSTFGPRTCTFRSHIDWSVIYHDPFTYMSPDVAYSCYVCLHFRGHERKDHEHVFQVGDITTFNYNERPVSTFGPRTRTFRCFARWWFCWVFLWWWCCRSTYDPRTSNFRCFARL